MRPAPLKLVLRQILPLADPEKTCRALGRVRALAAATPRVERDAFGSIWKHLEAFGAYGGIWKHLEIFLEAFERIWKHLEAFSDFVLIFAVSCRNFRKISEDFGKKRLFWRTRSFKHASSTLQTRQK